MTFVTASLALAFFLRLFSFFVSFFPPFLWFGWSVASPCAHMWQQLWSLSLSFHLCAGRTWQRFVPFRPFSFSFSFSLPAAGCRFCRCGFSLFLLFITLLLLSQQCASVCASVCAPLYASMRAPLFQLGQLQIKQNTHIHTHTQTHSHVPTKLADELTDN